MDYGEITNIKDIPYKFYKLEVIGPKGFEPAT